jgi:hypothetical protein
MKPVSAAYAGHYTLIADKRRVVTASLHKWLRLERATT